MLISLAAVPSGRLAQLPDTPPLRMRRVMAVRHSGPNRAGTRFDNPAAGFYHAGMKIELTPHQQKFVAMKMKGGGYLSESEVVREALRVYELADQEDNDPELAEALRQALR